MEAQLIGQGFDLMLYGMGTVFVFLTLLVIGTSLMSSFVGKYLPDLPDQKYLKKAAPKPAGQAVDARTLSIIQDAVYQHRAKTQ